MDSTKPPIIDPDRLLDAVEKCTFDLANTGFCIACGHEQEGCEPDARNYKCENEDCGELQVFGAQELLIMGYAG